MVFRDANLRPRWFSRDQPALLVLHIHQATETVVLQFKDEIGIVKCFANELEAHGLDAGEHALFYQDATVLLIWQPYWKGASVARECTRVR